MNYSTPGVYINEESTLPMSMAALSTAIPAFIGMTAKCPNGCQGTPVKISSLLAYTDLFGTSLAEPLEVEFTDSEQQPIQVGPVQRLKQIMYYNMQLYFNNGGGVCYIVSLGDNAGGEAEADNYKKAIASLEKKPDITLLTLTDAAYYLGNDAGDVYKAALVHCNKMQNRFVIFDTDYNNIDDFRNAAGSDYLKYGAAYTPYLATSLNPVIESVDTASADSKIKVYGHRQRIETNQFKVNYKGEKKEASFTVNVDEAGEGFIVGTNALTINAASSDTVELIIGKWDAWDDKDKDLFTLKAMTGKDGTEVDSQEETRFSAQSHFCTTVAGLFITYQGSPLANPTVTIRQDGELTDVDAKAEASSADLVITFTSDCTNQKLVGAVYENDSSQLTEFSVTVLHEKSGEGVEATEGVQPLNCASFYTNTLSGLKIDYVGNEVGKPTVTFSSLGSVECIVDGNNLTINAGEETPVALATIEEVWNNTAEKGGFAIDFSDGEDPVNGELADENPHQLWLTTNSVPLPQLKDNNTQKYNQVLAAINAQAKISSFPPSGAIAGLYNKTDEQRGIWQSPANISIHSVVAPGVSITPAQQANLNEDPKTGKSINAIRPFLGKGTLVWGARTLDGNSNDWRYISVRRLISYIESTIKNNLLNYVFESNNAMTWLLVRTMIEPFLENLWQQGALVGSAMGDAFFCQCRTWYHHDPSGYSRRPDESQHWACCGTPG